MLKSGAWLLTPLLILPLRAQEPQVLPDNKVPPPAVDTITPVPLPEIHFGSPDSVQPEMPKNLKINNQGGAISGQSGVSMHLGGPVRVDGDNGLQIFSNTADLDLKAKSITFTGNVSIYQGDLIQRGQLAVYFYETKFLDARNMRASLDPILMEADKFTAEKSGDKEILVGEDAGVTTNDTEDPNYWVRAKKIRIYPGDKIVFNDLKLYAGNTPVFWLPYLSQPLSAELGYHFIPGARSSWGPFLMNTYGIMLGGETDPVTGENKDAWLLSKWHLDLRAKRGVAAGVDLIDQRVPNPKEISGLSLYYIHDLAPDTSRSGVPRGFVNEDRYKFQLKERIGFSMPDKADWRFDTNLTLLSDAYYLEDFETAHYSTDPQPDNTVGIYRRDDNSLLSLFARFQLNDFYRADTRLPEIAFDQARGPIFGLPIQHEGSTSFGLIGEQAPDVTAGAIVDPLMGMTSSNPAALPLLDQLSGYERSLAEKMLSLPLGDPRREALRTQLLDPSYVRFNTQQEFSMPMMLGGFLSLTPEAGVGYTNYSSISGPNEAMDRTDVHVGMEASVKFSKDLGSYYKPALGLDGLMHVFQPYVNWSVVSTNDFEPGDPGVDRLTPTTRPRPLDPLLFTAVDQMNSWDVVRLGVRNRLLTKRDGQSFEWLYLDTYVDAFIQDPEGQRNFSNLYNDLFWQPLPWLGFSAETQVPIANNGSGFSEFNTRIHYMPTDRVDFSLGYRWLNGHPVLPDSSRFDLQSYIRLTENWGFGTRHVLELDDGTLEYQQYTLHRDLGNWVAALGVSQRDNRLQQEYGLVFMLTLKDFPSASLPFMLDGQY